MKAKKTAIQIESERAGTAFGFLTESEQARLLALATVRAETALSRIGEAIARKSRASGTEGGGKKLLESLFGKDSASPENESFKRTWSNAMRLALVSVMKEEGLLKPEAQESPLGIKVLLVLSGGKLEFDLAKERLGKYAPVVRWGDRPERIFGLAPESSRYILVGDWASIASNHELVAALGKRGVKRFDEPKEDAP